MRTLTEMADVDRLGRNIYLNRFVVPRVNIREKVIDSFTSIQEQRNGYISPTSGTDILSWLHPWW